MEKMDYFHARKTADDFFWNIFCDNYLEFIKIRYYGTKAFIYKEIQLSNEEISHIEQGKNSAIATVCTILKGILTLYSPFCPFVCEKVHEMMFGGQKSIHAQGFLVEVEGFLATVKAVEINAGTWIEAVELFRKSKTEGTQFVVDDSVKSQLPLDVRQYIGVK